MRKNLLITLALSCLPSLSFGQAVGDLASVTVLPGWREADGTHVAALRIDLAEGWKTYWRAPGDTGIPPAFAIAGTGIVAVQPHFPVPEVYETFGMRSIGYENSVTFPLRLQVGDDGQPVGISGQIEIGVCDEVCIPVTLDFAALLPPVGASDPAILAALRDRPLTRTEAQVGTVACSVTPISDGLQLATTITMAPTAAQETVVIEAGDPQVWVSEPQVTRQGNQLTAVVDMVHVSGQPFALDRSALRFTVLGDGTAVDIQGCTAN
ncbi:MULTISPECIES: protein-disulfide reductase DsbD domain-containing protein [unclassified Yoonia]|uniref:protein-disulfide reductase DsbD domain-containing protein n=1 Tax=unclassified Yoonia TaxID=2629118 RepID=UPI002AFF4B4B|nr:MULTISPECIES: protein-disulfide reductase DsbD domain-containing protein [unclassified Yoonia]